MQYQLFSRARLVHALTAGAVVVSCTVLFTPLSAAHAITAINPGKSMHYRFAVDGNLRETGSMGESSSPYWWLNSGGFLTLKGGTGMTAHGTVPLVNTWRTLYAKANPLDTDNGTHPQNLLRLVSRSTWDDVRVEASYRVNASHYSASPNRNASNGLLLMSRYQGGDTLYYAGIRVDGKAVIKKKKDGVYTTLASKQIFPGSYSDGGKTNLIPHHTWITLRSQTVTNPDGSVTIALSMKKAGESSFTQILETKDRSNPITGSGHIGLRTDFMDVEFDDVKAAEL